MDLKATADALAGRFTGITATVGSTTESLELCTARLPNAIGKGPVLLVYPPTGLLHLGTSRRREDTWDYLVKLLRDPVDMPERTDWLYAWANAMRDRVEANYDLDLAYVAWAGMEGEARLQIDGEQYSQIGGAFAPFDVVEMTARVRFDEIVVTVAI
jgi:hypothetical protein